MITNPVPVARGAYTVDTTQLAHTIIM